MKAFLASLALLSCTMVFGKDSEKTIYDLEISSISGKSLPLSQYKGQVLLVVNTASQCGFTKQLGALEKLYSTQKDQGLVVLGVPSNSFDQELKDEKAVADFCKFNYGVNFPMTKIVAVKGEQAHPLFKFLSARSPLKEAGEVKWNFEKFLIDRQGLVVGHFRSATSPDDEAFQTQLKQLLAVKTKP